MPSATQVESNVYRIIITFPDGLQTNFGKMLDLDFLNLKAHPRLSQSRNAS